MFRKLSFIAGTLCLGFIASTSALADPPSKDILVVTGQPDLVNSFTPTTNGTPSEYFYEINVPAGSQFADTIPVTIALTDFIFDDQPITVTLKAVGQLASAITFSSPTIPITGTNIVFANVYINSTALTAGVDYHTTLQIDGSPSSKIDTTEHNALHLLVHVTNPEGPIPPVCYITDSTGLLLNDCSGNQTQTGGEFFVVTNQKKITATNPGQFYYNLTWTNTTGAAVTFSSVALNGTNVVPVGTNSVHVLIYDSTHVTANFDDVNTNGVPCGSTGTVCKSTITVPNGQTLWLTWHVAYKFVGQPAPSDLLNLSCPASPGVADATITMNATLTDVLGLNNLNCGPVTASGYTLK